MSAAPTFNEQFCQEAVRSGGYYWNGSWYPMAYRNPYPFYYDSYQSYRASGGQTDPAPGISYSRPAGSVERGGFGATGEAHGASGGEAGVGE